MSQGCCCKRSPEAAGAREPEEALPACGVFSWLWGGWLACSFPQLLCCVALLGLAWGRFCQAALGLRQGWSRGPAGAAPGAGDGQVVPDYEIPELDPPPSSVRTVPVRAAWALWELLGPSGASKVGQEPFVAQDLNVAELRFAETCCCLQQPRDGSSETCHGVSDPGPGDKGDMFSGRVRFGLSTPCKKRKKKKHFSPSQPAAGRRVPLGGWRAHRCPKLAGVPQQHLCRDAAPGLG